jgi:hypothetical protein
MPFQTIAPLEPVQDAVTLPSVPDATQLGPPAGPGWFESSRDLLAGLEVIEESDNGFAATR